jgi:hypothetical protein
MVCLVVLRNTILNNFLVEVLNGFWHACRYHIGLGDLYDQGRSHNRVWQFSVGFDL